MAPMTIEDRCTGMNLRDVRDLDAREDLGCFEGGFTAALGLHEARFIVARSCRSAPCGEGREPGPLSDK